MAQFNAKAVLYFFFLATLAGLGDCWSTIITETCTVKTNKAPATVTKTKTVYSEEISTVTVTPTDLVALSTVTETISETATLFSFTGTATVVSIYTDSYPYYLEDIVNVTSTDVITVVSAPTTTTIPTPSGFTPASANAVTSAPAPIRIAVAGAAVSTAVGRVVCTEKHILSTTVFTTITAAVVTVTETTAIATAIVSDIASITVTTEDIDTYFSYTNINSATSTYGTYTHTVVITTSTTVSAPVATAYPACAANNLITMAGNISIAGYVADENPLEFNATDAYNCCVQCFETDKCTGSMFYAQGDSSYAETFNGNCFLFTVEIGHKCRPAKKDGWAYYASPYNYYNETWTASNGPCGQGYLS